MTDIDAIRRKHEAQGGIHFAESQLQVRSLLTISDVDQLFKALDAERGKVEWLTDTLTTILWSYEQLAPNDERIEQVRKAMDAMKGGGE